MKLLVTGGCGFLGSNLASHGIGLGYDVTVFDNLSRIGSIQNLVWLKSLGEFKFIEGDIKNRSEIEVLIKNSNFDAVFHLAGQVAMTTSIADPFSDFEINAMGSLNLLEAIRKFSPETAIFYSSTNKVYGDLEQYNYHEMETRYVCEDFKNGFSEATPLNFQSPYGCSKGSADQYMLDYYRIYGLKTTVFRHSSMYGSRQFSTADQGWVGWFCEKAIEKYKNPSNPPFTISGNGKQVRDILHAKDMINLYYTSLANVNVVCGNVYNIGGTMEHSLSLLELFEILNRILNIKLEYIQLPARVSDQKIFVADIAKINNKIDWRPKVSALEGVTAMVDWITLNLE